MKVLKWKKGKGKTYLLCLDNKKEIPFLEEFVIQERLLFYKEVTADLLNEWIDKNNLGVGYRLALNYLDKKMRTKKEVYKFLKEKETAEKIILKVIERLEQEGYLDEEKYINAFLHDAMVLSLDGPLKIARDLAKVGIEDTSFFADVKDEVWEDRMAKLATKKLAKKTKDSGAMLKQKLATFLYSHGYDYEFSKSFIQNLPVEEDLDNLRKEKEQYFKKYASKYEEPKLSWVVKGKLQSKGYTKESILKVFEE